MFTVADALRHEALAGAQLIAGKGGIHKAIRWVHNAGVPDAAEWLNGGELVLTTYINMPEDEAGQCAYIQAMADKGVTALALAVGRYIDRAPDYMRVVAEQNNFPLLEIPYTLRFVDVAKSLNERISQQNMEMVTRAMTINRVLTQLVLDGGNLKQLAKTLADLIGHSISIENERFEILASHNLAEVDEARRYTLSEGRTNPNLVNAIEEHGILGEIRRTMRPVFIPQIPEVGLEMERILAPIVVHGEIYGYVWIIADDKPLSDLEHLAIESGATIAALMLLHQETLQSAEASLKGGLLSQLLEADATALRERDAVLTDQALRFGVDLSTPYVLLLVENDNGRGAQKLMSLYRRINRFATNGTLVSQFAGQVVLLAQATQEVLALVERIHAEASADNGRLRIGVSGVQRGAVNVALAYQQCREVLHITRRLSDTRRTVRFEELGYLHALYMAGTSALNGNPYVPGLRLLMQDSGADLFNTLETYLDAGGNGVQTADLLHIHRSTLNYRLARIVEICNVDLSDPLTRTNLQVALKLLRLFEVE
jgi:PucR family transcriptional regulator, purine catabolism regulatory protein